MASFGKKIKELNLEQALKEESFLSQKKRDKVFPIDFHIKKKKRHILVLFPVYQIIKLIFIY